MATIAQEVIHEEQGAYVARTILVWDGLTKIDDARYAVEPVTDPEWQAESCKGCQTKDEEICNLEEKIEKLEERIDEVETRWRERCKLVVKIARQMIAERDQEIGRLSMKDAKRRPAPPVPAKSPRKRPTYKR